MLTLDQICLVLVFCGLSLTVNLTVDVAFCTAVHIVIDPFIIFLWLRDPCT